MRIIKFLNPHRLSNTYLVYCPVDRKAIIIDLGNVDQELIIAKIKKEALKLEAVFLTHEHADHCMGVDELAKKIDFQLFCTKRCATGIASSKLNFSRYLEDVNEFEIEKRPIVIDRENIKISSNLMVECLPTPGHSPGSCCYFIKKSCFTGDTLMESKTPLSFPNSNREEYVKSIGLLNLRKSEMAYIYPGHGNKIIL